MSSTVTDMPLHEVVLKIMFFENMEKAAEMTPADVLWRIDNPEISERQVREVLDWLIHQKKATRYLGKYSIDRVEFLKQKEQYETSLENDVNLPSKPKSRTPKKSIPKRKTFYINPPKVKPNKYHIYILTIGILMLGYLTYTFLDLDYKLEPRETLIEQQRSIISSLSNQKQLYVSKDDTYTENEKNAISYSFSRQNTINTLNITEFNRLQFVIDSITQSHKNEIKFLQTEFQHSANRSNSFLKKIVYCNILVISLFVFFYFRRP